MPKNEENPNSKNNQLPKKKVVFKEEIDIRNIPKNKKREQPVLQTNTVEVEEPSKPAEFPAQKQFESFVKEQKFDEALELLNQKTADINKKEEKFNYTLFLYYASLGDNRLNTIKWLIDNGADTQIKTDSGSTLLHRVSSSLTECPQLNHYLFIERKLAFDVNSKNILGQTPLHQTAISGNVGVAQFLIENGANINEYDNNYLSILYYAAIQGKKPEIVQLLIDNNVDTKHAFKTKDIMSHSIFLKKNADLEESQVKIVKIIKEKIFSEFTNKFPVETELQDEEEEDEDEDEYSDENSDDQTGLEEEKKPPLVRAPLRRVENKTDTYMKDKLSIPHTLLNDGKSFRLNKGNSDEKFKITSPSLGSSSDSE